MQIYKYISDRQHLRYKVKKFQRGQCGKMFEMRERGRERGRGRERERDREEGREGGRGRGRRRFVERNRENERKRATTIQIIPGSPCYIRTCIKVYNDLSFMYVKSATI